MRADTAEPIVRRSLHDELVDRLRTLIVEGALAPGTKVPEKELCARFGVSRTPMREALKVLGHEALIDLVPNRGAVVARLTCDDVDEVFPIMGALEALAGELACANLTDATLTAIRRAHAAMEQCYDNRDLSGYFAHNEVIHELIAEMAGNPTLLTIQNGLQGRVRRARYLANMSQDRWATAIAEHRDMLAALEARDGARLGAIMRAHLEGKRATVKAALEQAEAQAAE
ncbi:MAG: GntR family transcriptional regulator [Pseudomonadota bacterium]